MAGPGGSRLPGAPVDEGEERIVLHVDMDCFYAACERLREPELVGEPVVVGMGYESGETIGAVATASYEAREYGVESAQAISTALDRLPRKATADDGPDGGERSDASRSSPDGTSGGDPDDAGYYRSVDMEFYQSVAADVKEILHDCADVVREVSIDEAYLDVTDRTAWDVAEGFARHVKGRIEREVGVPASVGVAPSMSAAKIASDHDKPDGLVVVGPGEVREFLGPLQISDLHGIGPVTAGELRERGIETIGDLAEADDDWLVDTYGDRGRELVGRARGEDDREVTPRGDPKSLSRESAFAEAVEDEETKRERVRTLARAVADRARREEALYRTVTLPGPVDDPELVEEVALELLAEFDDVPLRKVGVRVSNLSFAEHDQSDLAGWEGPEGGGASGRSGRPSEERSRSTVSRPPRFVQATLGDFV